jgi:hypothetical protein
MGYLYINAKGNAWKKHSYSAGNDWTHNPYFYYLRRVLGWKLKDTKAAFRFGRALEEAIQVYHETEADPEAEFVRRWAEHKDNKDLVYTKTERDWATTNRMGAEMMRLYVIRRPSLPLPLGNQTVFQREFSKEVFPGDPVYGEIEDVGKLDMIAYNDPEHPLLTKMEWNLAYGLFRPVIVDIKTSALDFPEQQGMAAFDLQLRRYSWLSGIRDAGLLWFKKHSHGYSKGSSATLLTSTGYPGMLAGDEVVAAWVTKKGVWIVRNDYFLEEMEKAQGRNAAGKLDTTKEADERKLNWLSENAKLVPESYLTRQRLQFNCGFITKESADNAGLIAAKQIKDIADAWIAKQWPNTAGVRYPSNDTNDPYFRAFILQDEMFKKCNFTQAEEQMEDLFEDDAEAE